MVSLLRVLRNVSLLLCLLAPAAHAQEEVQEIPLDRAVPQSRAQVQLSFSPVVKKVAPAVVNIYTSRTVQVQNPFMNDPLFRHFFRGLGMDMGGERKVNSLGSGVIISHDGLVVTSNHVIQGAQEVKVVLSDRREFEATVILHDPKSDLALLRLQAKNVQFPFVKFRDSDSLEVGDLVLALGNPFGVGQTVTSGIISALARTTVGVADFQFFIQTDAAINPGNSGGALVDMEGNLIGVNTAIYSTSGASNGIGFAIPSNMVQTVVATAAAGRDKVIRPWLGIRVQKVTGDMAESMGLEYPQGVLVNEVEPVSPASQGGIGVGDVILAINGKQIFDEQGLMFRSAISKIGDYATFRIRRSNGQELERRIKMVPPPEIPAREARALSGRHPFHGVTVANLSPAVATELDMDALEKGVVVAEIAGNRLFRPGDIIVKVNNVHIENTKQLAELMKLSSTGWSIVFKRDGQMLSYNVKG